jgi:hypothetical protein
MPVEMDHMVRPPAGRSLPQDLIQPSERRWAKYVQIQSCWLAGATTDKLTSDRPERHICIERRAGNHEQHAQPISCPAGQGRMADGCLASPDEGVDIQRQSRARRFA